MNWTIFRKMIRADLVEWRIPFITLRGTIDERVGKVTEIFGRSDPIVSFCRDLDITPGSPTFSM